MDQIELNNAMKLQLKYLSGLVWLWLMIRFPNIWRNYFLLLSNLKLLLNTSWGIFNHYLSGKTGNYLHTLYELTLYELT
jgi:hypothetical protein